MIPEDFIRDLNERTDLADLIGGYVKLERKGANWSGLCPFHSEKTPSFTVSPSKGFYHCFGCGAHGSAIGFIQQMTGADFVAAVEKLAALHGLAVPRRGGGERDDGRRGKSAAALEEAMRYYCAQLKDSERAKNYLKQRGMTGEIAAKYKIGYAPKGWDGLRQHLDGRESDLLEAGLLRASDGGGGAGGRVYDYFRDRIMFPVLDGSERVRGFGARAIDGDNEPKYLNSPDSRAFSKRHLLYGLPQAARAARAKKRLIVCEGYMDVAMLAQAGYAEAVATMGTAATAEQMKKAAQYCSNLYFAYDGDAAGQKGARRAMQGILPALKDGVSVFFLFLPDGHDPDSYVRAHGAPAFEKLLGAATPLGDFLPEALRQESDAIDADGQATGMARAGAELLRQVSAEAAPAWRDLLQKKLENSTGVSAAVLARRGAAPAPARKTPGTVFVMPPQSILYNLLCCIAVAPSLPEQLPHNLPLPGARQDAELVAGVLSRLRWRMDEGEDETVDVPAMLDADGYPKLARQLRGTMQGRFGAASDVEAEVQNIVRLLQARHRKLARPNKSAWRKKTSAAAADDAPATRVG